LEAEIFIDQIFNELNRQKIYCFTRHDSVIVGVNNIDRAYEIIENEYRKLGFVPKLEIEYYFDDPNSQDVDDAIDDDSYLIWDDTYDFILNIDTIDDIRDINNEQIEILIELGWQINDKIEDIQELETEYIEAQRHQWTLSESAKHILYNIAKTIKHNFIKH